ncbi:MAG: hypothetical protein HUJ21_18105, partial [Cyclobacterium sp.]|nr:hypothetical protein [Cyclobacterium sp.]
MKIMTKIGEPFVFSFCLSTLVFCCQSPKSNNVTPEIVEESYYSLEDFDRIEKIDAHVHLRTDFDTVFIRQAARDKFRLLNVSVYTSPNLTPEAQENFSLKLISEFPDIVTYGTTFSLEGFTNNDWESKTLDYLEKSISRGAKTVKVWKNIGMELKN